MEIKTKRKLMGCPPKPLSERKVQVHAYVKRKHYREVQELVTELAKKYR